MYQQSIKPLFDFIAAFVSNWAVDGLSPMLALPIIFLGILLISNVYYHRLQNLKTV